jgi:hypothetical protein
MAEQLGERIHTANSTVVESCSLIDEPIIYSGLSHVLQLNEQEYLE